MIETPLHGGRITEGVVCIGDTVRRPCGQNADFAHALLDDLASAGFRAAPRFLGTDEKGREILSFMGGDVPADLGPDYPDETLAAAARLIRAVHDATGRAGPAGREGGGRHHDLAPCNGGFEGPKPVR